MMITNLFAGLIALSLFACNNPKTSGDSNSVETEVEHGHAVSEEAPSGGLSLNNGVKWQTDESTMLHAANLNTTIDAFEGRDHQEVSEYHVFAADLQRELGGLVKDCKMNGPEHEALHIWLEPVMKDAGDLKTVKSTGEGKRLTENLSNNIKKFNQYFQHAD